MTKAQINSILKKIEAEKAKVAASRDRLRELISDLTSFEEDWDAAVDNLNLAADAISELL